MSSEKDPDLPDLKEYLISKEEAMKIAQSFHSKVVPFLKKNRKNMLTLKGAPEIYGVSTTFGPYIGKTLGMYISKNSKKSELKSINLRAFYSDVERMLIRKMGNKITWRTNLLVNSSTREPVEVEFIPMSFRGDFFLDVLGKSEAPLIDISELVHAAVIAVGKSLHETISEKGYLSTYPKVIKDIEKESPEQFTKEIEEADFHIDLRFVEKGLFLLIERELLDKFSESSLETKIGLELIKEAIPILIQYEIKADFPKQESTITVAKPDFIILDPFKPAAIFCDSYRYHQRKKDQIFKDRRIDRRLQRMGFVVFRFSEEEISRNLKGCIEEIKEYYLGKEYSLSASEVFLRKLAQTDPTQLSEWEKRFVEALHAKLDKGQNISLKEERILNQILDKSHSGD
jgi:hypothetical protein